MFCTRLVKLRAMLLGYVGFKVTSICFCDFRLQQSLRSFELKGMGIAVISAYVYGLRMLVTCAINTIYRGIIYLVITSL
jgi:hypothetical protein